MTGQAGLRVSELFGPTLQGEGPSAGQLASFIRLSGCNLSCRRCDTPYTWDWRRYDRRTEQHRMTPASVLEWALGQPAPLIVVMRCSTVPGQASVRMFIRKGTGSSAE